VEEYSAVHPWQCQWAQNQNTPMLAKYHGLRHETAMLYGCGRGSCPRPLNMVSCTPLHRLNCPSASCTEDRHSTSHLTSHAIPCHPCGTCRHNPRTHTCKRITSHHTHRPTNTDGLASLPIYAIMPSQLGHPPCLICHTNTSQAKHQALIKSSKEQLPAAVQIHEKRVASRPSPV